MPSQVIIVQPYVPAYRVPLFERLHSELADDGVDLVVAHGRTNRRATARHDAAELGFSRVVGARQGVVGGHEIRHRRLSTWKADLVIGEHAIGSMDTYELLVRGGGPTALWGHTRPIETMNRSAIARITRWQLRHSRHFFAYTARGREEAIAWGMDRHAITVLNNTTDTTALRAAMEHVTQADVESLRTSLALGTGPVIAFIGALDASKRPDLYLEALDLLHRHDPTVQGVVAGEGDERAWLEQAVESRPWLHLVGRADTRMLAVLGRTADLLLNPAAIGLVAVDALVLGLPVVTSPALGGHGPEFGYLVDGRNAVFAEGDAASLADAAHSLLVDPERATAMRAACREDAEPLTIETMAARFRAGIIASLG